MKDLMKPRYKVIAGWPGNDGSFNVGSTLFDWHNKFRFSVAEYSDYLPLGTLQKFPHLFKPLSWWEERKAEDMPEYVKYFNGNITKLTKDMINTGGIVLEDYQPSTESEYLQSKEAIKQIK